MGARATTIKQESKKANRLNVIGLKLSVCNYKTAIEQIIELVKRGKGGYVCVSTVHMAMEAFDNTEYQKIVNEADLVTPDGMPMFWMKKLQGAKNVSQVRGTNLMMKLFGVAEENDFTVGFYGGSQEVLDELSERLEGEYPNLKISYIYSPPFRPLTEEEDREVTKNIAASETDILFVGLGCPKQERWMADHADKVDSVMIGVGAAFNFYAGKTKESPEWMRKIGLEWLYRLLQEPRRLWKRYIILNPRFVWQAMLQLTGLKKFE